MANSTSSITGVADKSLPVIITQATAATNTGAMTSSLQSFNPATEVATAAEGISSSPGPDPHGDFSLADYQNPKAATTPTHKLSALHIGDSPTMQPKPSTEAQSDEGEEGDEVKLIDAFNSALSKACAAGRALQRCCEEKQSGNVEGCLDEGGHHCQAELKDYKEKCLELTTYEKHLKEAYEEEHKSLLERLREMEEKKKVSDREHKMEVDVIQRKHVEEVKELQGKITLQAEFQSLQHNSSIQIELNKLMKSYQEKQNEVEDLRTKLAEKEKALFQLGDKIELMQRQVLMSNKEYTEKQLKRCQQIEGMLSRLQTVKSGKEMGDLTTEIFEKTGKMKASSMNKRSTSWRN